MPIRARWGHSWWMHTDRAVFARRANCREQGESAPSTIHSRHFTRSVREWGFHYKKINDSTTSQFTDGSPYTHWYQSRDFQISLFSAFKSYSAVTYCEFFYKQEERHRKGRSHKFKFGLVDHAAPRKLTPDIISALRKSDTCCWSRVSICRRRRT